MKHLPTISIAIPTFNEHDNINRCLSSVFNDKYNGKLEVFIIDGGSTDDTITQAKKFPVKVLFNPFKHAEYGKKIGLENSRGKYFMILDCDMSIVGDNWFQSLVRPLEINNKLSGSFTGFTYYTNDLPLNRFISFDPIQRDPLFSFLTPAIKQVISEEHRDYKIVSYKSGKIIPAGFVLNRISDLTKVGILNRKKYMELDNLSIFVKNGKNQFAYINNKYIYHPFLTNFKRLISKRIRNIETMYFNQPDPREWTWIDWTNWKDTLKIFVWVLYVYTILPSLFVGIFKTIKYGDLAGMLELPFNILTTNVIILSFITNYKNLLTSNLITKK